MRSIRLTQLTFLCLLLIGLAPQALGQTAQWAVLLLPESDIKEDDIEFVADLNEVLIASLRAKAGKDVTFLGKEVFRKSISDYSDAEYSNCLSTFNVACIRRVAESRGVSLVIIGKIGMAMNGYRVEVRRMTFGGITEDRSYRKRIEGGREQVINDMDNVVAWAMTRDDPLLTIEVSEPGASVTVDGTPVTDATAATRVKPGSHEVKAVKDGFADASSSVDCQADSVCKVRLVLVKSPDKDPGPGDNNTNKPVDSTPDSSGGPGLMPWAIAAGSVALASGIGGTLFYLDMLSSRDEINKITRDLCPNNRCKVTEKAFRDKIDPVVDDGNNSALWANVLGVVSIVSAVGAATLLTLEFVLEPDPAGVAPEEKPAMFTPLVLPSGLGLMFDCTF